MKIEESTELISLVNSALKALLDGKLSKEFIEDEFKSSFVEHSPQLAELHENVKKLLSVHLPGMKCPFHNEVKELRFSNTSLQESCKRYPLPLQFPILENANRDSNFKNFKLLFESNPFPMLISKQTDGTLLASNKSAAVFLEFPENDIPDKYASDYYYDDKTKKEIASEIKSYGYIENKIVNLKTYAGNSRWATVNIFPILYYNSECFLIGIADITRQKNIEESTRRQAEILEAALDNMGQGFLLVNKEMRVEVFNEEFLELFNSNLKVHQGIDYLFLLKNLLTSTTLTSKEQDEQFQIHKSDSLVQTDIRFRDGKVLEIRHNPLKDGGFVKTVTDVSKERKIANQLKLNEENFRTLFHSNPLPLTIIRKFDSKILAGNAAISKLFESDSLAVPNLKSFDFYFDINDRTQILSQLMLTGEVKNMPIRLKSLKGNHIWTIITAKEIEYFGEKCLLAGFVDITKQKEIESDLEEWKSLLDTVIEQSPSAMILVSSIDKKIIFMNQAFKDFHRLDANQDYRGSSLLNLDLPCLYYDSNNQVVSKLQLPIFQALQGIPTNNKEFRVVFPNGSVRWRLITTTPIYGKKGNLIAGFALMPDITASKLAEIEMAKSRGQLMEMNSAKDKLFSIISHDLKNPFHIILGITDLLHTDYDMLSQEELKKFISSLADTSRTAYNLLENLLLWSRLQRGLLEETKEEILLYKIVNSVYNLFEISINKKNITFEYVDSQKNSIFTSAFMVETILRNLINNAIKFTKPGGSIKVLSEINNGFVKIMVKDNGVGISKDDMGEMFKKGVYSSTKGTGNERGTGLGLHICQEFVEILGGSISVESTKNVGSTFSFTIPLNKKINNDNNLHNEGA